MLNSVSPKLEIYYPARPAALLPLSFGRVNDGRPVTSQMMLFRLPIELVQEVVAYLNTSDFRSLALVDRDCRQLARSRLFTSVVLDYSIEKRALLDKLSRHEVQSRQDNGGITENPSIGACIRSVTVAAQPWVVRDGQKTYLVENRLSKERRRSECKKNIGNYCGVYLPSIAEALRSSLPDVDQFIWKDTITVPRYMIMAIASSPIRHLGLHRVQLSPRWEYQLPPPEQQRWALRSLYLEVGLYPRKRGEWREEALSEFCTTILKAVAPTLERLSWKDRQGAKLSFGGSAIRFPRLRTLMVDTTRMPDDTVLEAFFPPDEENYVLRSVSIKVSISHEGNFLVQRGHLQGLESLRLDASNRRDPKAADAVSLFANPQLKSLTLRGYKYEQLNTRLLPLLASNFRFLTTLVIYFPQSGDIPPDTFAAIARLLSLTSLWMVAKEYHQWRYDVQQIIAVLSPLRNLTRLALSRQFPPVIFPSQELSGGYQWRMRDIVELFVKKFRGLRWIYFGHLVFKVVENELLIERGGVKYYSPERVWESPDWR